MEIPILTFSFQHASMTDISIIVIVVMRVKQKRQQGKFLSV